MEKEAKVLTMWEYIAYGLILTLVIPYFLLISFADSPQLRDSLFILIFSAIVLAVRYSVKPRKPIFSYRSMGILALAYLSLLLYKFSIFFTLGALVLTLTSVAILFLDRQNFKLAYAFGAGFYAYSIILVLSPIFDFKLRLWAGLGASKLLNFFSVDNELLAFKQDGVAIILRCPSKGDFLVASQCNGLSVLASALILSLFMAIFSQLALVKKFIYVAFALGLAYVGNILRICTIVMLNPSFGKNHYFLMHETVGYTSTIATLLLIYVVSLFFVDASKKSGINKKTL